MGRYRLDGRIGRGGMGEVWRGHDLSLNRPVAVKVLLGAEANEEIVARFRREALIGARLQHPGITIVHDIGHHDGQLFIVMELLDGEDLAQALGRSLGGLPVHEVFRLAVQAVEALAAAHEAGVVHRDLKPGNLFVLSTGRLKICDFGIARPADATAGLTQTGRVFGTPAYMAPEQWRGEQVDARSDLYSLGCVVYALLTGAPPFGSDGALYSLARQHLEDPPPRLPEAVAGAAPGLDVLVGRLLAKDPADRPDSARSVAAVLAALRPAGDDRPQLVPALTDPGSLSVVAAALLREAAEVAYTGSLGGIFVGTIRLAARVDATLARRLMSLAEQWSWKDAQGDRGRLALSLAGIATQVAPAAPTRALRLLGEAQQVLFSVQPREGATAALGAIAVALAPLQRERAFELVRRTPGLPVSIVDEVLVGAVAAAKNEPWEAEDWLDKIQGEHARFTALSRLAAGVAERDLAAAFQVVERLPPGREQADALSGVADARLRLGDVAGTNEALSRAKLNVMWHAQEAADGCRAQATVADAAGSDRLAQFHRETADAILEAVREDPFRGHFILPFTSSGTLAFVRADLEIATGARDPDPLPTMAAIQQGVRAARAMKSPQERAEALRNLAGDCLGPWTGWTTDLDHPGTSAWPSDVAPTVSPAPSGYGRQAAVAPGAILWRGDDQLESSDRLFSVGDVAGWSCGERAGVIDAGTGAALWTADGDAGVTTRPVTAPHRVGVLGTAAGLYIMIQPTAGGIGRLVARHPEDGRVRWSHAVHDCVPGSDTPAMAHVGGLLIYADGSAVTAIDGATGAKRWSKYIPHSPRLSGAVAPGCLIVAHPEGFLGLHPPTGRVRWSRHPGARPVPTGFAAGDPPGVVHLRDGGLLHALDTATGSTLWSRQVGEYATTPLATDGLVITGTYDPARGGEVVTAITEYSGEVAWQRVITRRAQTEAESACGLQLIGARSGLLFAKSAYASRRRLGGSTLLPSITALDLARGRTRWRWEHPGLDMRPALLHGASLIVQIPYPAAVALPHP
ncbi:protein kinase domain-containing protein [Streptomyces gardneri]|uniref:protein kinase domain-containing protein n=1 Tax=Streptomyces gardneri TaxID=66892 RepID=UPI0033CA5222